MENAVLPEMAKGVWRALMGVPPSDLIDIACLVSRETLERCNQPLDLLTPLEVGIAEHANEYQRHAIIIEDHLVGSFRVLREEDLPGLELLQHVLHLLLRELMVINVLVDASTAGSINQRLIPLDILFGDIAPASADVLVILGIQGEGQLGEVVVHSQGSLPDPADDDADLGLGEGGQALLYLDEADMPLAWEVEPQHHPRPSVLQGPLLSLCWQPQEPSIDEPDIAIVEALPLELHRQLLLLRHQCLQLLLG